jgi:hypothetical protein
MSKHIKDNVYATIMSYSCEKCNYHTVRRENYNRHMLSLKHNKENNEDTLCTYCNKKFKHSQSMYRHIKYTCKKNKDEDLKELVRLMNLQMDQQRNQILIKDREIEYQKQQIDKLMDKLQVNHITTNINILSYRDTDLSHLTNKDYMNAIKKVTYCVKDMIEKIHFNPLKPENMNIYISNMKDKYIMVYEEGNWIIKHKSSEIDNLYESKEILLEDWLDQYGTDELRQKYNKYLSNKENDDIMNTIKDEIKMMMYNKKLKLTEK